MTCDDHDFCILTSVTCNTLLYCLFKLVYILYQGFTSPYCLLTVTTGLVTDIAGMVSKPNSTTEAM